MLSNSSWLVTLIPLLLLILLNSNIFTISISKVIAQNDYLEYKNIGEGIRIQYPSNWKASHSNLQDYTNIVTFYSPLENITDTFPENVEISIIPFAANITLEDYNTRVAKGLGISPELRLKESNFTILGGKPGYRILVSSESNNTQLGFNILRTWMVEDNKVYSITYTANSTRYNAYLPIVEKMIDSFEIINRISNRVPSVTAHIGCANASSIQTAYFDANGFPPNTQIGISLSNNNNNTNIHDPHIVLPNVPSHVLTDNSGSWGGQFNYYFSSGGNPFDNEGKSKYSVSIFVDENRDAKPDHPNMVATSPITC
jgi:hypothetical protein